MEPESHRSDREAMLAEHRTVAERLQREVEALVQAAASERRAFLDQLVDRLRLEARLEGERDRIEGSSRPLPRAGSEPPVEP